MLEGEAEEEAEEDAAGRPGSDDAVTTKLPKR
jgi:hypothetical protein